MDLRGPEAGIISDRARGLLTWLLLLVAIGLAALFLQRFVLIEFHTRRLLLPVLIAVASALAATAIGGACRRLAGGSLQPKMSADFLVGYPIYGALCFLAALISTSVAVQSLVLLAGIALFPVISKDYRQRGENAPPAERSTLTIVSVAILALALAGGLLSSQLPPSTLDELAYHLAIPKAWLAAGRSVELPLLSHSYFPLAIESADLPMLAILGSEGGIASHFLHWLAALATTILLVTTLRRWCGPAIALATSAAIVTTPALLVTAGWSWNEWPLVGICVVLVGALRSEDATPYAPLAIAAGLLTKYTFYPVALIAFLFLWTRVRRRGLLLASAAGLLFPLRNLLLTGNPLAPFLATDAPAVTGFRDARGLELFAGYLFDGRWIDESLGFAAIALAFGSILLRTRDVVLPLLIGAAGISIGLLAPSSRVLLPYIAIPAIYGAIALKDILTDVALRRVAAGLVAASALQLFAASFVIQSYEPWDVLSARLSDVEYVDRARASAASVREIDVALPDGSRTLVVGIQELGLFEHDVVGGGNADGPRVNAFLQSPDLLSRLSSLGITHVAIAGQGIRISAAGVSERERERVIVLDDASIRALSALRQASTVVTETDRFVLLQLR